MKLPPVGAQLLVFGKKYNTDRDADLILDAVAAAGYAAVEAGPKDAKAFRRKLEQRRLKFGGMHVGLKQLLDVKPIVKYLSDLGGTDVCNSALMTWEGRSSDDYREGIAALNRAGKELRRHGIHLHYHNHDFEFQPVHGARTGMDLLLEGLDPEAVDLCVDVAWVYRGGLDPAEFLQNHADMVGYLHFKDWNGGKWAELGNGKVDFAAIMKVMPRLRNARWVMIEQDDTDIEPIESATASRRFLREKFGY